MVKFLDLKKQYLSIKDEIDGAIAAVVEKTAFIGGNFLKNLKMSSLIIQEPTTA